MTPPAPADVRRHLASLRMAAQGIVPAGPATPGQVVRSMLAMQGQDLPGARWSIGLRGHVTDDEVGAAFDAGDIVRSWPMRGTLHVVAAEDIGWMLELMAPRVVAATATRRAQLGITADELRRAGDAAVGALDGGRVLTREALLAVLATNGIGIDGQRGYHFLGYLAQTGVIVLGPVTGRQQSFALLGEWVRTPRTLERDEALGELADRYFRSHGPATERDLARWSGLPLRDVRRGTALCSDRLARLEIGGITYHLAPEALDGAAVGSPAPHAPDVRLLPGFDEYLLGYLDRTAALAAEHAQAVVPGNNGMFLPTIVIDGDVVGTWRRAAGTREAVIRMSPFGALPDAAYEELLGAVLAYGAFLGRPARIA